MVRALKLIAVLTLVANLNACREDEEPKEVLLTVELEADYFSSAKDAWLFISDKNGNTIDAKTVKDSLRVELKGPPHSSFSLSFLTLTESPNGSGSGTFNSFGLRSFQELKSGTVIKVKKEQGSYLSIPNVIGSASITIRNYNDSPQPEYALTFSDGIAMPYGVLDSKDVNFSNGIFSSKLLLRSNPSKILVTCYHNNLPVYRWLTDVKPGINIDIDFNSFSPLDIIPINKQAYSGSIKSMVGTNFATSFIFSELYQYQISKTSDLSKPPMLGYLPGFEKYFISVTEKTFNSLSNLYYDKAGAPPTSINLPDYSCAIKNPSLFGLSVDFSNQYTTKEAYFIKLDGSDVQITWTLNASDKEEFTTPLLPIQIKEKYPKLYVDDMNVQFVSFTHYLDGYTYEKFIADLFNGQREVYEKLRYVVKVK